MAQIPPILKLEVGFFFDRKVFESFLLKYGELGHFASLEVSKKVIATYRDFDFFPQKYPQFWNLKLDFFFDKKFLKFFADIRCIGFLWTNYDQSFKIFANIFFPKRGPILGHDWFFVAFFWVNFENWRIFVFINFFLNPK